MKKTQSTSLNCCFLMHLTHVLCKLSVVEYSYRSINWIINLLQGTISSNYINFHVITSTYGTINFENLIQLV
jgi:hypothetical protein